MVELEELQSTSLKSDRSERIRTRCKTLGDYSWLLLNFISSFLATTLINKFRIAREEELHPWKLKETIEGKERNWWLFLIYLRLKNYIIEIIRIVKKENLFSQIIVITKTTYFEFFDILPNLESIRRNWSFEISRGQYKSNYSKELQRFNPFWRKVCKKSCFQQW